MHVEVPPFKLSGRKPAVIRREPAQKSRRVLVLPDIHLRPASNGVPSGEDTESLAAVERYVSRYKWDEVVVLGDLMDFDCISAHNAQKLKLVEGKRIQKDYDHGNRFLDRWQRATGSAVWTLIEGNHDERIERYIEANPVLEGSVEMAEKLNLAGRGIRWVRFWTRGEVYSIGNAHFIHGLYCNKYHAERHARDYGVCIFYGHTHDVQEMPQTLRGSDKTIVGQSMGFLGRYDQPYMKGRPSKWQQAFGVFHFMPNGYFNHFVVRIFDHKFISPEGELCK
jgi:hypothetical protein